MQTAQQRMPLTLHEILLWGVGGIHIIHILILKNTKNESVKKYA